MDPEKVKAKCLKVTVYFAFNDRFSPPYKVWKVVNTVAFAPGERYSKQDITKMHLMGIETVITGD